MVHRYHDGTKHHFQRFARRRLSRLGVAAAAFRGFAEARVFPLYPAPGVPGGTRDATFDEVTSRYAGTISAAAIGDVLRHALGLSAWKVFKTSRWALRVNPSSGNLHPTEAYVVCGTVDGLAGRPAVYHYAPDRHALELRCAFDDDGWRSAVRGRDDVVLVALTSIHWREAWKYGERAFRYCQHDLGHAIAAVSIAAGLAGWRASMLPAWYSAPSATTA
jgi:SagB-type dehydrogenase family enzyme